MIELIKENVLALATILKEKNLSLATAESCTGGGLSYWLTSVPGSSQWFDRGFVTYSEAAKRDMLNVDADLLKKFGAVSEQTVCAMAKGVLQKAPACQLSIAISGVAGPDGGSAEKPVGLVWIAWGKRDSTTHIETQRFLFSGDRQSIRLQSIQSALEKMRAIVSG